MNLTATETRLLRSIREREQLTIALYLNPVGADWRATLAEVEVRLGLAPGSVGATHRIDFDTGSVVSLVPPAPSASCSGSESAAPAALSESSSASPADPVPAENPDAVAPDQQ